MSLTELLHPTRPLPTQILLIFTAARSATAKKLSYRLTAQKLLCCEFQSCKCGLRPIKTLTAFARYGPAPNNSDSAVNILLDTVLDQSGKTYKMDHYATRYPTNVIDIANFLVQIVSAKSLPKNKSISLPPIIHFSGAQPYTKYEMCLVFASILGVSHKHIIPQADPPKEGETPRPRDTKLYTKETEDLVASLGIDGGIELSLFEEWWGERLKSWKEVARHAGPHYLRSRQRLMSFLFSKAFFIRNANGGLQETKWEPWKEQPSTGRHTILWRSDCDWKGLEIAKSIRPSPHWRKVWRTPAIYPGEDTYADGTIIVEVILDDLCAATSAQNHLESSTVTHTKWLETLGLPVVVCLADHFEPAITLDNFKFQCPWCRV